MMWTIPRDRRKACYKIQFTELSKVKYPHPLQKITRNVSISLKTNLKILDLMLQFHVFVVYTLPSFKRRFIQH